ncbi:MAG TPA: DUF5686 and carboxypeptidase regulatory-like domain-containing protein [Puia sp.]|nr:DUF5686 and carboxypeptidase regulatory-like domain-containing protein [Puia sp.]
MKPYFILFFCLFLIERSALAGRINGTVQDDKGNILPYASVFVKGSSIGTTTNNNGRYFLDLPAGQYTIVCQYVGYARQEKTVTLGSEALTLDFHLSLQQTTMKEVIVKAGAEDPAYEIIRHAIKKRKTYENALDSFTCEAYIKTVLKTSSLPSRILGRTFSDEDRKNLGVDSEGRGLIFLSESVTRISFKKPDKVKLEVISGRQSGTNGFGFNFPTFIDFYSNNVNVFITQLSPRGYVSPIADGALNYYKYKYLGSFIEDGKEVNQIRVTPKRRFEPLFTGTINITEGDWRIHSLDLMLTKDYQLEIVDTLKIRQIHVPIAPDIWRTQNQIVQFSFNKMGIDAIGSFLNVYSKYDLGPRFPRKYFNNVIVKYDTAVNKKTLAYWDSLRPVPLEPEEKEDYRVKDSIYKSSIDSASSKRVIDSLRKQQGRVSAKNILLTGISRSDYDPVHPFTFSTQPLLPKLQYNTVEGLVIQGEASFLKENLETGNDVELIPHIRYGFSNTRIEAWGELKFSHKKAVFDMNGTTEARHAWIFSGGRRVSQFNADNPISPLMNELYTLFVRKNYMKIYENWFGSAQYKTRLDNGLLISGSLLYEDRIPLNNTSNFSFFGDKDKPFTPNYPYEQLDTQFTRHQALIAGIDLQFRPGQQYIEFPDNRLAIGSKYPTLELQYRKGIPGLLGSDVDYDKWQFSVWDNINFKLRGELKYRFSIGGFLNTRDVFIQDYQHFNGNRTFYASQYLNSFQLAPYYENSTIAAFYATGHLEHHFNGMLTNKVPLLRNLQWNLVAGANAFYVNSSNNYFEIFGGLENILKIFRVDVVASYLDGKTGQVGVRVGMDGLFGGFLDAALRNPGGRPPQQRQPGN